MPGVGMEDSYRDIVDNMHADKNKRIFGPAGPRIDVVLPKLFTSRKLS